MSTYSSQYPYRQYDDLALVALMREQERLVQTCTHAKRTRDTIFAELYERLANDVLRYCVKIMGGDDVGREAMQETFVKLFAVLVDAVVEIDHPKSYSLRIARNVCLNMKRSQQSSMTIEDVIETMQCHEETPAQRTEREQMHVLLNLAMEQLHDDEKEVLTLRVYNECSYQEIADVMQQPVSTITNRLHRAKERLRRILQPIVTDGP